MHARGYAYAYVVPVPKPKREPPNDKSTHLLRHHPQGLRQPQLLPVMSIGVGSKLRTGRVPAGPVPSGALLADRASMNHRRARGCKTFPLSGHNVGEAGAPRSDMAARCTAMLARFATFCWCQLWLKRHVQEQKLVRSSSSCNGRSKSSGTCRSGWTSPGRSGRRTGELANRGGIGGSGSTGRSGSGTGSSRGTGGSGGSSNRSRSGTRRSSGSSGVCGSSGQRCRRSGSSGSHQCSRRGRSGGSCGSATSSSHGASGGNGSRSKSAGSNSASSRSSGGREAAGALVER